MANNYYQLQYTGNKVIQWKNFTDTSTPLSAANLQKSHQAIDDVDQAVNAAFQSVDNTKLDKILAGSMLIGVDYDDETGVMVFHHYDNSIPDITFNTNLQKLVVNFAYDPETERLLLTQADGTVVPVDLSAFISNPDLRNSSTIAWTINADGSIQGNIRNNSITDEMIEAHYLASIMSIGGQVEQAAQNADYYAKLSQSYANGTSNLPDRPTENVDNSRYYMEQSQRSAIICGSILTIAGQNASDSEAYGAGTRNGQPVQDGDPAYHNNSRYYKELAEEAVIEQLPVMTGATATTDGSKGAAPKPLAGQQNDLLTGAAQYKSLDQLGIQTQELSSPITIAEQVVTEVEDALNALNEKPAVDNYNDLQNKPQINGNAILGNKTGSQLGLQNVVLASAITIGGQQVTEVEAALQTLNNTKGEVTGVKGNAESNYRTGNVNLTPANIGALATNGDGKNVTVTYTTKDAAANTTEKTNTTTDQPSTVAKLTSGETLASMFGKISAMFKNIRKLWNTVGTTSVANVAGSTLTEIANNIVPVGTVLSVMTNSAPTGYLLCDGSTYNISDYTKLANHFNTQFGSKNFFGGNGTTTFKVPDLRGEFLRGSGTNSHANQGSGGTVGQHQDSTEILEYYQNNANSMQVFGNNEFNVRNSDKQISSATSHSATYSGTSISQKGFSFAIRPTNTSVNYCIKY